MKNDIKDYGLEALRGYLKKHNQPAYRAQQILSWVFQKRIHSFSSMENIPRDVRQALEHDFSISQFSAQTVARSSDGTHKFLFLLDDGNAIESVYIPEEKRNTICVSSQVGCRYGCVFCASSKCGFVRSLTQAEILNQVMFIMDAFAQRRISNIVFMGIGEPLDNYDVVRAVIDVMNAPWGFGIGQRKITISTAGVIEGIRRLAHEGLQVELSVSLHSADDTKRSALMPLNKKYPLSQLLPALKEFCRLTKRRITFEYMLLGGYNCLKEDAECLVHALKGIHCSVNLIAYNAVAGTGFSSPTKKEILFFKGYVEKHGFEVTLRKSRGQDIDAACGQLRLRHHSNKSS